MLYRIPQRWLMVAITVMAGLLAAWAARHHIQGRIAQIEAEARVPTVARLVAAYDLAAGTRLDEDYVAVREIPREWAPSDALAPEDFSEHTYSVLAHPLRRGDTILRLHLTAEKAAPLSSRVPAGRRAITMPVDDINSLSGMLQAGDLLDLYVSFEHGRRQITAPLLQGVLVLATGREGESDDGASGGFSTITLDAGPEDAVKLVAARQAGRVTAILRHHRDAGTNATAARGDLAALLGIDTDRVPPPRVVPVLYGDRVLFGVRLPVE
jgi:pilus assembly protein CpaB